MCSMRLIILRNANHVQKGELRQNQFGVSGGGPIWKNKIFIFGDYEGLRRIQGTILEWLCPNASRTQQRLHRSVRI